MAGFDLDTERYEHHLEGEGGKNPIVILEVRIPDPYLQNLKADMEQAEDYQFDGEADDWKLSLEQIGDVMYEGSIPASWIREP